MPRTPLARLLYAVSIPPFRRTNPFALSDPQAPIACAKKRMDLIGGRLSPFGDAVHRSHSVRDRLPQFICLLGLIHDSLNSGLINTESLHLGNQCCTFKPQPGSGSSGSPYYPSGIPQCLQDQSRFVFAQCTPSGRLRELYSSVMEP